MKYFSGKGRDFRCQCSADFTLELNTPQNQIKVSFLFSENLKSKMKAKITVTHFLLCCIVITLSNKVWTTDAAGPGEEAPADLSDPAVRMECKILMGKLMKRQLESISRCIQTFQFKDRRDRSAKLACILKCVLIEENFLTEGGLLELHFVDMFFSKEIPKKFHKRAVPILKHCFDHNAGKVNPKEELCMSYKPFLKCILDAFPKFCVEDKEEKKSHK